MSHRKSQSNDVSPKEYQFDKDNIVDQMNFEQDNYLMNDRFVEPLNHSGRSRTFKDTGKTSRGSMVSRSSRESMAQLTDFKPEDMSQAGDDNLLFTQSYQASRQGSE